MIFVFSDIPRIPDTSHPPLESSRYLLLDVWSLFLYLIYFCFIVFAIFHWFFKMDQSCFHFVSPLLFAIHSFPFVAGSSSFESQKMDRPTVNALSPTSPGKLQNALQLMPGRLSVSPCLPAKLHWRIVFAPCLFFCPHR